MSERNFLEEIDHRIDQAMLMHMWAVRMGVRKPFKPMTGGYVKKDAVEQSKLEALKKAIDQYRGYYWNDYSDEDDCRFRLLDVAKLGPVLKHIFKGIPAINVTSALNDYNKQQSTGGKDNEY